MSSPIGQYLARVQAEPLQYQTLQSRALGDGLQLHRYLLQSQVWPAGSEQPQARWQHPVDMVIPDQAQTGLVVVLANNRSPWLESSDAISGDPDFDADSITRLARSTGACIVSVAQIPNQPLLLPGAAQALAEDDLVAATWRAHMDSADPDPGIPLQVPMTAAVVRAMDLWEQLQASRPRWLVAGVSKRGGAAWLSTMNDPRIVAMASFGLDIHFQAVLGHIEAVYAGQWPPALGPYVAGGITARFREPAFTRLMAVIDPYARRDSPEAENLRIPKLVVNASGDDFFPPDSPALYAPQMPPPLALHTLANTDHAGIRRHVAANLIPFVQRVRDQRPLPAIQTAVDWSDDAGQLQLSVSELPHEAICWQANNPLQRDFRVSAGVLYRSRRLALDSPTSTIRLDLPAAGWSASYIQLRFADGLQLSSPVWVRHSG